MSYKQGGKPARNYCYVIAESAKNNKPNIRNENLIESTYTKTNFLCEALGIAYILPQKQISRKSAELRFYYIS